MTPDDPATPTYTHLSVNINLECAAVLKRVRTKRNISITETVRRAIALMHFIEEAEERGERLIIEGADGKWREVKLL